MRQTHPLSRRTPPWLMMLGVAFSLAVPLIPSPTALAQNIALQSSAAQNSATQNSQPHNACAIPTNAALLLAPAVPLTDVAEIVRRVDAAEDFRHSQLRHYQSTRTYHLVYNGIGGEHIADLVVAAQYDAPGIKHLTVLRQTGSPGFGNKVLRRLVDSEEQASERDNRRAMAFTPENFEMQLSGRDSVNGVPAYVLTVRPRGENRYAYSGKVWVSMADFGIMRVQGSPAKSPAWVVSSLNFDTRFQHCGDFWLPQHNETTTHLIMGGQVKVTIDYGPYASVLTGPAAVSLASVTTK